MFKKTITATDYNGVTYTEDYYFNMSKPEIAEMENSKEGGFGEYLKKISGAKDEKELTKVFKDLILKSYGVKSPDGRRFIKTDELSLEFSQTDAYSVLYMELATDSDKASEFIKGIFPSDIVKEAEKQTQK